MNQQTLSKLAKFGSKEFPIRSSSLPMLMTCSWRAALLFLKELEDSVGAAAHTGSALHKCVEGMHKGGKSFDDCMLDAKGGSDKYPKADWNDVRLHFQGYHSDPRNQTATILACEKEFKTEIETNIEAEGIRDIVQWTLQGTFDQIRLDKGRKILYDIKTGSRCDAYETLMNHTLQLAAYWIGAEKLGHEIDCVGIIYTYGYRKRNAELPSPETGVFVPHPMNRKDCDILLKGVARQIQSVRNGHTAVCPGSHCNICPAKSVSICLPLYTEKQ